VTRRELIWSAVAIFAVSLVVRVVFAAQIVFPKPEDTAYYVGVARNLLEGRGLVSDALFSYSTPPLVFPRPAFEIWLPLPTFLALIPMAILGPTFTAAQVSSVLIGSIVPVLAWRQALDVAAERGLATERARWVALGTGLTAAVYLPLVLNSALPDSTMLFGAIVLGACLLMTGIARSPAGARLLDPRLVVLGLLLGLGALTRNETVWLALIWVVVAWRAHGTTTAERVRLVATPAIVALLLFLPWAVRDYAVFGNPLPGQAINNALYLTGYDLFAWNDPPTLARHLALGVGGLIDLRVTGFEHNLINVLLLLGLPVSALGLVALPWQGRGFALRPLVAISLLMFVITSLLFPAATQWGTFLHAAAPVHVLLVLSGILALDAAIAALGRRLSWERSVTWVGAVGSIAVSLLFSAVLLPSYGQGSRDTARHFEELGVRMAASGHPLGASSGPVISNFPIWMAETQRVPSLALPNESPEDVMDLAAYPAFKGTHLLVLVGDAGSHWPADLRSGQPGADCFVPLDLGTYTGQGKDPLATTTVYDIRCPGNGS
jgi:hypothetical protein